MVGRFFHRDEANSSADSPVHTQMVLSATCSLVQGLEDMERSSRPDGAHPWERRLMRVEESEGTNLLLSSSASCRTVAVKV